MPRRRRGEDVESQASFAWTDPKHILDGVPAGEVLFEAPELKPKRRKAEPPPKSIGLPFGVREVDGTPACWSCGQAVSDETVVRVGPGDHRCPGCGAKLPFL